MQDGAAALSIPERIRRTTVALLGMMFGKLVETSKTRLNQKDWVSLREQVAPESTVPSNTVLNP
jgi:hypothetical protein